MALFRLSLCFLWLGAVFSYAQAADRCISYAGGVLVNIGDQANPVYINPAHVVAFTDGLIYIQGMGRPIGYPVEKWPLLVHLLRYTEKTDECLPEKQVTDRKGLP